MKTLISSVVLGVLLTGSAIAADLRMPAKAPPAMPAPAPVYNWTGCYIGGGGGYGMFDREHDMQTVAGVPVGPEIDTGGRGWFGTVQGGCDIQFGSPGGFISIFGSSMLFGVFADGSWGSIRGTEEASNLNAFGDEKLDESWAVGARLGWLPTNSFLTFVSGGFTSAHIQDINYSNLAGVLVATLPAHSRSGWFIGTGYEYNLGWWQGLTWKTEYRWSDYGSNVDFMGGPPAPVLVAFNSNTHLFVQTIRSELIWRFNWGGYSSPPVMSRY